MTKHHEPFTIHARVYYEDTDAGGIVYHANYLKFAERGRTEYLRFIGWDRPRVEREFGIGFIVRHAEIEYRAPAKLDDLLTVKTTVAAIGNTSMTLKQDIWRDDKLLAEMKITVVAVNAEGKAVRFPPQLRQIEKVAVSP
jgi:acyl-CoA thioester hydrolase